MPEERTYPYNDDYMVFNELSGRYVITEKALLSRGINLRARISRESMVSPETVIENLNVLASDMIYGFIHRYNADNATQDCLIAKVPQFRPLIMRAMLYQAEYIIFNGNLSLSADPNERAAAISPQSVQELEIVVPCYGSILYMGAR